MALASALTGGITDPRTLGQTINLPPAPAVYPKTLIAPLPAAEAQKSEILRGPNIAPYPDFDALDDDLILTVSLKTGDNITTDHIMPAGADVLPLRSNIPAISKHVFAALKPGFSEQALLAAPSVIIGGSNYGQGSSREHAALAPRYLGVKAKVVKSFARIHLANLINFGIVPLTFVDPDDYEKLAPGQVLNLAGIGQALKEGKPTISACTEKDCIELKIEAGERDRKLLLAGGLLNYIRQDLKK